MARNEKKPRVRVQENSLYEEMNYTAYGKGTREQCPVSFTAPALVALVMQYLSGSYRIF